MKIKVKICGITNLEDARLALGCGADELGFVLAPSPRRVEPERVRSIVEALRSEPAERSFKAVGVFVNESPDAMRDIISFAGIDAAQVHGDESPEDCDRFPFPWYRALRVGSASEALALALSPWSCPRLLVDASSSSSYGGTGTSVGVWAALAARAAARSAGKEFFVAGGVKPRNAASFVYSLSPDGLDVSSGVEESPGRKSPEKLASLFRAIREAVAREAGEPSLA